MRTNRLIETFPFTERQRSLVTLGTGMRLHPELHLLVPEGPPYPAAAEARTWVWNPKAVKQWVSFSSEITHSRVDGEYVTSAKFRLGDGTDEYYWDGGAWAVATTQWSTEEEVSEHIASFPVTEQKIQIAIRLETTDSSVAARCTTVKVCWAAAVDFLEDLVYRSLVPYLRDNVRPIAEHWVKPGAATTTIDLNTFPTRTPYNIVDIDSVFDLTDDPNRLVDLFSSYDPGTKVITLSGSLPQDHLADIRFTYEPEVAVSTSPEYHELAKLPVLLLEDVNLVDAVEFGQADAVVAKHDFSAVKEFEPLRGDLEVLLDAVADKGVDMHRLVSEVKRALKNVPILTSAALDRGYSLWLIDEYDMRTGAGNVEMHTGRLRFRVRDVTFHVRDSVDSAGVKRFLMTGTEDYVLAEG